MDTNRTYTATELNDMGYGAANNAGSGSVVNLGGTNYVVTDVGNGTRRLSVATSGSTSGSSTISNDVLRSVQISDADKKALEALALNKIQLGDFEKKALEELKPYYERLLAESNYDVEVAKKRLEEDYQKGLRGKKEDIQASLKQLGVEFTAEKQAEMEDLNKRGLLDSVTGKQAPTRTMTADMTVDKGNATASTGAGQPVTGTYNPMLSTQNAATAISENPTVATFGGIAGKQMATTQSGQDARQEAIVRAFKRSNEEANLDRSRKLTDYAVQGERKSRDLTQERNEKVSTLGADKYQRALQETQLKRQVILEPYQMKLQGLSY